MKHYKIEVKAQRGSPWTTMEGEFCRLWAARIEARRFSHYHATRIREFTVKSRIVR